MLANRDTAPAQRGNIAQSPRSMLDASRFAMLKVEEEQALARAFRDDKSDRAYRKLIESHMRLVSKIASTFRGYGLPMDDLQSEGMIGLMHAVQRFDPDKGFRLSTYAMWWIRAAIQQYILQNWSLVRIGGGAAQKKLFFNLRKAKSQIGVLDGPMTDAQAEIIAEKLSASTNDVRDMEMRLSGNDVSLHAPIGDSDREMCDLIADESVDVEGDIANRDERVKLAELLKEGLATLKDRERDILIGRRLREEGETLTLQDLGNAHGISRERVRQIEERALLKLRAVVMRRADELGMQVAF
jgi:RNA polymerase sigma-32 factor